MPTITESDIRRVVSRNAFDLGMDYHLDGRVQEIWAAPDGALIRARVSGTKQTPYEQTIHLMPAKNGTVEISGTCTCPVGSNCKLVAAVLFVYQDEEEDIRPLTRQITVARPPAVRARVAAPAVVATEAPLPYDIAQWLGTLPDADQADTEDYPPNIRKRLFYVLRAEPDAGAMDVALTAAEIQRDDSLGKVRLYAPYELMRGTKQQKFLRPADRAILRVLNRHEQDDGDPVALLQAMLATGRAPANRPAISAPPCAATRRMGWRGCNSCAAPSWAVCSPTTWGWARRCRPWRTSRPSKRPGGWIGRRW